MKFQAFKGIALFQVLIMTAIMSIIALSFSYGAKNQVDIARAFEQRLQADLKARTALSDVYYTLFTLGPVQLSDKVVNNRKWNLRNQPIDMGDGVSVKIQGVVGLFSLITTPDNYLYGLLNQLGIDGDEQKMIINSIKDWRDPDSQVSFGGAEDQYYQQYSFGKARNGPMQYVAELKVLKGMSDDLFSSLESLVTAYPTTWFNPVLAPELLVRSVFPEDIAGQIIQMQRQQSFSEANWRNIVGFSVAPEVEVHPGSIFSVEVKVIHKETQLVTKFDIKIQAQQAKSPLTILRKY